MGAEHRGELHGLWIGVVVRGGQVREGDGGWLRPCVLQGGGQRELWRTLVLSSSLEAVKKAARRMHGSCGYAMSFREA